MQRSGDKTPNSVSIAFNTAYARGGADYGGAIYTEFGQLSIDGMQFLGNRALRGGAISMRNMDRNPASITRSYFRDNSAQSGEGASIQLIDSKLNLAGDTFLRNDGGIQVKSSDLDVINSTFLGSPAWWMVSVWTVAPQMSAFQR